MGDVTWRERPAGQDASRPPGALRIRFATGLGDYGRRVIRAFVKYAMATYTARMWIPRTIERRLEKAARTRPVVVLTGARQTGKTSLLRRLFPRHDFVALDIPSEAEQAEKEPRSFLLRHEGSLLIDEVQYAPSLFRYLKAEVDAKRERQGRFLLTGSQKFVLMKGVSESLAGRAEILDLETLSFAEIQRRCRGQILRARSCAAAFPSSTPIPRSMVRGITIRISRPTWSAMCVRWRTWAACATSNDSCARAPSVRPICSTRLIWRVTWASRPLPPTNGSPCSKPPDRSCCSSRGSRTRPSPSSRARSFTWRTAGCSAPCSTFAGGRAGRSPAAGAVWETFVFAQLRHRERMAGRAGNLFFWRDRTREVDFLIEVAGRIEAFEAKWTELPNQSDCANLSHLRRVIDKRAITGGGVVCRAPNAYPLADGWRSVNVDDLRPGAG